jgi:hypothetical protein
VCRISAAIWSKSEGCSVFNAGLELENCDMVRSEAVADGAAYSRKQPNFNLRIVKGAALVGLNTTKLQEIRNAPMLILLISTFVNCK